MLMQNFGVTNKEHYHRYTMVFLEWPILRFQSLPLCPEVHRNAFTCFNYRHYFKILVTSYSWRGFVMTTSWHHVSALASSLAARSFKSWIVLVFTGSIQKMVKRPLLCRTSVQQTIFPFPEVADSDLQIRGGGGGEADITPLEKGGPGLKKNFLGALRASVWSKNKRGGGGWAPQAPPLDPPLPSNSKIYEKGLRSNQEPIIYPDITKPRCSEPNFVSPLAFVISRFHSVLCPQFKADLSWWSPNSVVADKMAPGRKGRYTYPDPEIRGGGGRAVS